MNILVINGPNLNLLGSRLPGIYGKRTLKEINNIIKKYAVSNNVRVKFFQTNHEGEIIDIIHKHFSWAHCLIINPGAYTHYSYAIRDAIESTGIKAIEVHLTDISKREKFRRKSVIKDVCVKQIKGLGYRSYIKAIDFCLKTLSIMLVLSLFSGIFSYSEETSQKNPDKFRFGVMGCMHMGWCESRDYKTAAETMKKEHPDFVFLLGGMIDALGPVEVESLCREFEDIAKTLDVPVHVLPAADRLVPLSVPQERMDSLEKCFLKKYRKGNRVFEYKKSLFISLDSEALINGKTGNVVNEHLKFLTDAIRDASKYNHVFIMTPDSPWLVKEGSWNRIIHPVLAGYADYVIGSGNHFPVKKNIDGVKYISTGYPPCGLWERFDRKDLFHFLIVSVEAGDVFMESRSVPYSKQFSVEDAHRKESSSVTRRDFLNWHMLAMQERYLMIPPVLVAGALDLKPGMKVLDIGAGIGFFIFAFADALKGTGEVYGTDIDPLFVEYMNRKKQEGRYTNVFPVFVTNEGLDPFYKKHSFDRIFLGETYSFIVNQEEYFSRLRPFLKEDGGRLFVLDFKNAPDFTDMEFDDFRKIIPVCKSEISVFLRFGKNVREFFMNWRGEEAPPGIRSEFVKDINRMLIDPSLFMDFFEEKMVILNLNFGRMLSSTFGPTPYYFWARSLFVDLEEKGVFSGKNSLEEKDRRKLKILNRLLLTSIFRLEVFDILTDIYGNTYTEKSNIIRVLEKAGYRFVKEHDLFNYHYLLEFKRKT